jgi:protein-S-isoprenylcysteine O-methyltransferase Ste14
MFVGTALLLGSWWGLFALLFMMPAFIWRIFEEEGFLSKNPPGYAEYKNKVRHRLVPFIW